MDGSPQLYPSPPTSEAINCHCILTWCEQPDGEPPISKAIGDISIGLVAPNDEHEAVVEHDVGAAEGGILQRKLLVGVGVEVVHGRKHGLRAHTRGISI